MDLLAVLDFEATCADPKVEPAWDRSQQEIIELPVALVSLPEKRVVDTFSTFVRPTRQPELTAFCTELTTIRQEDVANAPVIDDVVGRLSAWLASHGASAERTCTVTCGDWDLRRMWPLQASLVPGLDARTPPGFRTWCNIKLVFQRHTGVKPTGMMSMLEHVGLVHRGTHHRGIDDVLNLCDLAIRLHERGARFEPTWTATERAEERRAFESKRVAAVATLAAKQKAYGKLPPTVPAHVRTDLENGLRRAHADIARLDAYLGVFGED